MNRLKRKENILRTLTDSLKNTERCRNLYSMSFIEQQNCVIAFFRGAKIVRVWLKNDDDFEMICEIIEVLRSRNDYEMA